MAENTEKSSKRRSQVWQHFEIINKEKAKCNCCDVQLHFRGSTFNLKRHLENKHKDIDVSGMLRPRQSQQKTKRTKIEQEGNDTDTEDSFYWTEVEEKLENGDHEEETQDIAIDSDHSLDKLDDVIDTKEALHVVPFDFQEFKNDTDILNNQEKNQKRSNYNVEISRFIPSTKKGVKKIQQQQQQRETNNNNDYRETQIFGDFVASQLRILQKKKREKLQILIQRAILNVVCDDSTTQET